MRDSMTRRGFLETGAAAMSLAALGAPAAARSQQPASAATQPSGAYERPPALDAALVKEFVGVAHRDLERVRAMLDEHPTLLNAAWDWTGGDWETAMGAAGHTGGAEIAELLLQRGARIELHAAAMLGWLEVIKAAVAARPGAENILGPHAIPMWSHARTGGEKAADVLAYLESIDAVRDVGLKDEERAKYVGRYRVEGGEDDLVVLEANRRLMLQPPQRRAWYLLNQGEGRFRPADNTTVKVMFELAGEKVRAMHIDEGNDQAIALRME